MSEFLQSTFLIERLVGVSAYSLLLVLFYYLIKQDNNGNTSKYLKLYIAFLCAMAFFYIPGTSADLFRWRLIINNWEHYSYSDFFNSVLIKSETPASYLLMFLTAKTHIDGLLPMICAFVFYANAFHVLQLVSKEKNYDQRLIAIVLLFLMSPGMFLEVISDIRCFVAFSIICSCFCSETLQNRSIAKSVVPYIIACLMHTSAAALLAIRLLLFAFTNARSRKTRLLDIVLSVFLIVTSVYFGYFYLDATYNKATNYLQNDTYYYSWEYIIGVVGIILTVIILFYSRHIRKHSQYSQIWVFVSILTVFELVFIWSYSIFHRFIVASTIVSMPLLPIAIERMINDRKYNTVKVFKILCVIVLIISCSRGNLSGYKFFVLT